MENVSLGEFNPKEAEVRALVESFAGLSIAGINDKEGYKIVHEARMKLRSTRVEIEKTGKMLREEAVQRQKAIIALEKSLVSIVEPLEEKLHAMEKEIDEQIEKEKRRALLPDRIAKLAEIDVVQTEEKLLSMTPEVFTAYFNAEKELWLNRKEAALKAAQEAADASKRAEQEAKDAEARAEREKAENERREREHAEAVEKAKAEAAEAERRRIEKEAADRARAEAEEQARLEKNRRYNNFLKKNGADVSAVGEWHVERDGDTVRLYKLVDTLTL